MKIERSNAALDEHRSQASRGKAPVLPSSLQIVSRAKANLMVDAKQSQSKTK